MKNSIDLSIIVPIYNVELYIEECLKSIILNNYNNIEIILVNDGTKDNSMKVIEKYLTDPRIKVINKENGGISSARNIGFKHSSGKFISFIDSDDWVDIVKLMELLSIIKKENLDLIVGNGYWYPKMKKIHSGRYSGINSGIYFFEEMLKKKDCLEVVWLCIYKKEFLEKDNILFIEKLLHEDVPFFFEVLIKAKKVKVEDIPFYFYRQREGSIVHTKTVKNSIHFLYGLSNMIFNYKLSQYNNKIINMYLLSHFFKISKELKIIDKNILKEILTLKFFTLKGYIKIIYLFIFSFVYKKIKINIEILTKEF